MCARFRPRRLVNTDGLSGQIARALYELVIEGSAMGSLPWAPIELSQRRS